MGPSMRCTFLGNRYSTFVVRPHGHIT
ncbi:hypothetical protein AFLA70_14g005860 [Aspergillus flavus AF70]|nr:hypothetical protein AFLA70_14g005860 [Aspergillus flavus AF70]